MNEHTSTFEHQIASLQKEKEELKQALKESCRAKSFLNTLSENERLAMWAADKQMKLLYFNEAIEEDFIAPLFRKVSIGAHLHKEVLKESLFVNHPSNYERALGGKLFKVETEVKHEGKSYWAAITFHPIKEDSSVVGVLVTAEDATEVKRAEEVLAKKSSSKDDVLSIVAHDLRNPINNIMGFTSLLEAWVEELPQDLAKKEAATYLEYIQSSCEIANKLIADLLEITCLENENFILEVAPTNLQKLLQRVLHNYQLLSQEKHIEVQIQVPNPCVVNINEYQIERVLGNLLSNAIKFSYEGALINITVQLQGKEVAISISDQGIGMNELTRQRLFDKFTTVGRRGTKGEKSTGLGMAIVKQIVLLHRGKIEVKSQENQGSTFLITLPV